MFVKVVCMKVSEPSFEEWCDGEVRGIYVSRDYFPAYR